MDNKGLATLEYGHEAERISNQLTENLGVNWIETASPSLGR